MSSSGAMEGGFCIREACARAPLPEEGVAAEEEGGTDKEEEEGGSAGAAAGGVAGSFFGKCMPVKPTGSGVYTIRVSGSDRWLKPKTV